MANVQISFNAEVEDHYVEELKRIVDHHLEYLIDFDGNPEITSISNATIKID